MNNMDLRKVAKENGVSFWQIALQMGISEPTMTRKLRVELPEQEKQKFLNIIKKISTKQGETA